MFPFKSSRFLASCVLLTTLAAPITVRAQVPNAPARPFEGLVVQGNGEVRVKPDIARLNLGVQTQDKDVQRASQLNATRTQALLTALRGAGIEARDIQTASFSVTPQYDYRPRPVDQDKEPQQPILTGYQVNNDVRVVVRRIENAGRVLDAAIRAGANTSSGLNFDVENRQPSRDEALRRAVADANRKANVLADAAGKLPIRLSALVESGTDGPRPFVEFDRAMAVSVQAATPVAPGEIVINAGVTAYYSFGAR